MNVYVVISCTCGEADYSAYNVICFLNETNADVYAEKAQKLADALPNRKYGTEMDPDASNRTTYRVEQLEVKD